MLRRGVALAPGPYEILFPGMAHDDAVLGRVVEAAGEAATEAAAALV
jgi:glutamate-1-semialdehyde 2,1-aminomutase